jgi:DNA-binding response OmpR family regulator
MKTINNIVIFDDDKYLNALLKGYCFANNIQLKSLDFDMEAIKEIENLIPVIVVVPLDLLNATNKSLELALLRRVAVSPQVKIFGLTKDLSGTAEPGLSAWIDVIIKNPVDISEFGGCINKFMLLINNINERRTQGERRTFERRSYSGRRSAASNHINTIGYHVYQETQNQDYFHDAANLGLKELQIDHRRKCLFLKGQKVDLTPKEFELVELLATDVNRIFTAEEIIKHLWPVSHRATKSDLYQYMHLLRKKIEHDPDNPKWIMTVKGFGYKLNVDNQEKIAFQG